MKWYINYGRFDCHHVSSACMNNVTKALDDHNDNVEHSYTIIITVTTTFTNTTIINIIIINTTTMTTNTITNNTLACHSI